MASSIITLVSRSILACSLSCMVFLSSGCITMPVNYGEPVKVISAEIDSAPDIVFDAIYRHFQKQPEYEIENKNISGGIVTVQTKRGYPLRYVFIIDRSSAKKCNLRIRGLAGVDRRTRRQDIPESVFNGMENKMDEFMQEINRRVKKTQEPNHE
jgi:hypothetical protein